MVLVKFQLAGSPFRVVSLINRFRSVFLKGIQASLIAGILLLVFDWVSINALHVYHDNVFDETHLLIPGLDLNENKTEQCCGPFELETYKIVSNSRHELPQKKKGSSDCNFSLALIICHTHALFFLKPEHVDILKYSIFFESLRAPPFC